MKYYHLFNSRNILHKNAKKTKIDSTSYLTKKTNFNIKRKLYPTAIVFNTKRYLIKNKIACDIENM